MEHLNNNTESRKTKHLNFEERMKIQIRLADGYTLYNHAVPSKDLSVVISSIMS